MRSLYEIAGDLRAFLDDGFDEECINAETGEFDEEKAKVRLAQLYGEYDKKIEGIALYVQELCAQAAALGEKITALTRRKKLLDQKAARLEQILSDVLCAKPFATDMVDIRFRKSAPLEVEESILSDKWFRVTETKVPDKERIKAALKAGEEILGARIIEKYNIRIK